MSIPVLLPGRRSASTASLSSRRKHLLVCLRLSWCSVPSGIHHLLPEYTQDCCDVSAECNRPRVTRKEECIGRTWVPGKWERGKKNQIDRQRERQTNKQRHRQKKCDTHRRRIIKSVFLPGVFTLWSNRVRDYQLAFSWYLRWMLKSRGKRWNIMRNTKRMLNHSSSLPIDFSTVYTSADLL